MAGGQGAWPHWAPVQGPSTCTGSPLGVTYLTTARQVTQMRSAAHDILLALLSGTICSLVSTSPTHIFLHEMWRNVTWTIYLYPSTINLMYYYTKVLLLRNYFSSHKSEMLWEKVLPKVNLPKVVTHLDMRCLNWRWGCWHEGMRAGGTSDHRSASLK